MIWNKEMETLDPEAMRSLQLERLQRIVKYSYDNIAYYREKYNQAGVKPEDIKTLDDIERLPIMAKDDLRKTYPFGLFAQPLSEVVRIHSSSGTTGTPVVTGYTQNDIDVWIEGMARTLSCGEVDRNDIIQITFGYGLFTGGFGFHYAAESMGLTVIPSAAGNTKRQIMILKDFGTTALGCTPSYGLVLAEGLKDEGIDPKTLKLRVVFSGAEPWDENMRKEIEDGLQCKTIDVYGLTEIIGPGVAGECIEQNGLHIFEDLFYPEILDPDTLEPLPEGETGELVFTTLTREASPMIRFRTRDITRLYTEPCPCGRTEIRMGRVKDRSDDMLIIRGINVFPSQIEEVLGKIDEVDVYYSILVKREGHLDQIEIQFEVKDEFFSDEVKNLLALEEKVAREIESTLGLRISAKIVEPRSLERVIGKRQRVIDMRGKEQ